MSPESTFDRQSSSHNAFVGRERELAELRAGLDDVSAGRGRLFLLSGEPGIGKTRLAEEISRDAAVRGMRVVWGRCWEGDGAPAYWPIIQILRACIDDRNGEHLKALLGSGASEIARLIPELKLSIPSLEEAKRLTDSESAHFRLFDAVATLLKNVARNRPLVIVVDDLHDADQPSVQMLRFIARATKDTRILIIGTYRDAEVRQSPELGKLIGDLIREGRTVSVAGLSQAEVGEFVKRSSVKKADDKLVADLYQATDGNPLFVDGVVRLLAAEGKLERTGFDGAAFKIPDGVRESIRRRLAALSDEANALLSIASAMGNEFEMRLLERISRRSPEQVIEQADKAVRIGVLRAGAPGLARQQFSHALIREVLYDDLGSNRRIELHGEIGAAIEKVHKDDLQPHVAALAHHFRAARVVEKAIDYSIRAGTAAFATLAYEEAGAHWRAALELMDEQGGGDRKRRADLLFLLGDESVAGNGPKAVEYLEAAVPLYEELGDNRGAGVVHSRLGLYLSGINFGVMDMRRAMEHFKKAEAQLAKEPESQLYGAFYFGMASACSTALQIGDGLTAAKRVMEMGEQLNDDLGWSYGAIMSSLFLVESGSVSEGLRLVDQARERAAPFKNPTSGRMVAWFGGFIYQILWDPREAQDWLASELAKPRTAQSGVWAILRDLMVGICIDMGELAKARSYLPDLNAQRKPAGLLFIEGEWELAGKMLTGWSHRSRTTGNRLEDVLSADRLARLHRFTGERAQALQFLQKALDVSVEGGDILFELATRSQLATIAADAGDLTEALPHLERCRQIVSAGESWRGLAGRVERSEAVMAAAQGEYTAADAQFEKAIATFRHYCLPWEEADTFQYWGRALLAANERTRAIEKFDAAIDIYHRHGASTRFVEYVMADKMRAQGSKSAQDDVQVPLTDSIHGVAAAVAQERADLAKHAAPDGTVSILFTDIENSTAMFEKLGDLRAHEILHEHNAIIREQLAAHQGFEVKSMGDGFMLAFSSARRALLCAIAIQRAFEAWSEKHPEDPIRVRIGVHTGEAIKEAGDFYGKTVILASRIAAEANGGEILVSSTLKEIVDNAGDLRFEESRDVELQGFAGQHRIHRARWYETSAVTGQTECIFRREGDYWTIAYDGKTARLKDAKGFHYIAYLLGHPGQEIRALDLVTRIGGGGEETVEKASAEDLARFDSVAGDLGNAGEMLDAQAKAAYQRRLTELEDELEEARELGNEARAEKAEDEIVALGRELKGAIGLAGRDRRAASSTERARIAVTKAIRLSLNKIAENDASLGKLLSTTIKTGTVCAYVPDDRFPVTWRL